jgi:Uma2 family endonuclease
MGLPLAKMTLAEFLVWEEQQPERYEFHRGEVFAMVGGTARHNRVILNLAGRIGDHLDGSSCQVFAEGMKVLADERSLYPDVLVCCGKAGAGDETVVTDPKLVIEVLSPSTEGYDKRNKFALYRTLPSLLEYVLVDPSDFTVEVFTRAEAGAWTFVDQTRSGALSLTSIEMELPMEAVFKGVVATAA